jgi:hypothetical protein
MASSRVNLAVAIEDMILIEKECDKRGLTRVQFIKEAIHEKLKNLNSTEQESDIKKIRDGIDELKKIILLLGERKMRDS